MARSQKQDESVENIADIYSQSTRFCTREYSEDFRYLWVLTLSALVMRKFS